MVGDNGFGVSGRRDACRGADWPLSGAQLRDERSVPGTAVPCVSLHKPLPSSLRFDEERVSWVLALLSGRV